MDISEEILIIIGQLEDAVEEKEWDEVHNIIESLDALYQEVDKMNSSFDYDYE
jgi:hypothetical protein